WPHTVGRAAVGSQPGKRRRSMKQAKDSTALESPSLVVLAANAVRSRILAGVLKPGARLLEEQLTAELAISRPPFREALRILENEGLIYTLPRRGSFVTTLTEQDVFEILSLRST